MNTKRVKNNIVVSGIAAALMVGFGASMAPAANAGALSGDCAAGTTYKTDTRTCTGTKVETSPYKYTKKASVTASWQAQTGGIPLDLAKKRPEAVGSSSITGLSSVVWFGQTSTYKATFNYPSIKDAPLEGWTDNGTAYERTVPLSFTPLVEREDTSSESAAIQAVMGATTSSQASSLLATATSAHGGLILQSSKDALAGSLSAAQAHVSDLQASELAASTESQKRTAASNAIKAVKTETTYAEANARLASAITAFNSLKVASKAALQASMDDATAHVANLDANERGATEAADIQAAFIQVVAATVLADAQAKLADAQALFDNAQSSVSARVDRSAIDAASAHVAALQVADLANKSAAAKLKAATEAIAAVSAATTYAAASSALVSAEAAYGTLDANAKASVSSAMNAAKAHVAALAAAENTASRGTGSSAGSSAGSPAGSSSADRAVLSPKEKINSLVKEILNIQTVSGPTLNRLVIASAEMNALAKANPAAIDANLQADIDAANKHVAKLMNVTDAQVGSAITVESVLVGRGENKASDAKHFAAVKKALAESKGIVLVTISADKDWSKAKRASYQKKMVNAAKAAGFTADQIRVAKPRPVETVSLYAFSPAA